MRYQEELIDRLAQRRRSELGGMSDLAYEELRAAVKRTPDDYLEAVEDQAFARLGRALASCAEAQKEEEFIEDDDAYMAARNRRIERLRSGCESALGCDEGCLDARAILALTEKGEPDDALERLEEIERGLESMEPVDGADLWEDAFARPRLRLLASIARARLETARYRPALATCESVAALNPTDELGARHTWAIALARLEDEAAFDELDARFGRQGNAWTHLTRALLLFKLDRMPAARRALRGFASLCRGGAYALLRPTFVEPYLPDRPDAEPGSYAEAMMAVHECDPAIMDTPDFLGWASAQNGFVEQAQRFARENDLDW